MLLGNSINAQDSLSLENALAITLKQNIQIKIKINDLTQVRNNEKAGIVNTFPKLRINSSASANEGNSSLEFATDDFPILENAESESKSISSNVEFSYNLFNGLGSIYTYQKLKKQSDLKSTELLLQMEQVLIKTAKKTKIVKKIINEIIIGEISISPNATMNKSMKDIQITEIGTY